MRGADLGIAASPAPPSTMPVPKVKSTAKVFGEKVVGLRVTHTPGEGCISLDAQQV